MSYSSSDFADDVTLAAARLMTQAEQARIEKAEDSAAAADAVLRILHAIPTPKRGKRRKPHVFKDGDRERVLCALEYLRATLILLKQAGATKTATRVRAAITSAKGALLAVQYRETKEYFINRRLEGTA